MSLIVLDRCRREGKHEEISEQRLTGSLHQCDAVP